MARPRKYPPELLDRGARLVLESSRSIAHVAKDLGVPSETLRRWLRQMEADEGLRPDLPTAAEREEIKALRREVYELRRANEILKAASVFFATSSTQTDRSEPLLSTSIAAASASSRSAGSWACRRPPTTSAPPASARRGPEGCLRGSKMPVHAAARWYSWMSPPSRSRRLISSPEVVAVAGAGGSSASPGWGRSPL
jgi:transposase